MNKKMILRDYIEIAHNYKPKDCALDNVYLVDSLLGLDTDTEILTAWSSIRAQYLSNNLEEDYE